MRKRLAGSIVAATVAMVLGVAHGPGGRSGAGGGSAGRTRCREHPTESRTSQASGKS